MVEQTLHSEIGALFGWAELAVPSPILLALAREAKTYRAEAVVELPTSVPLGPAFLGLLKPAVIGGTRVHVVLPDFDGKETVLHKRSQPGWVAAFKKKREDDPERPFGQVYGWGEERELSAKRLLILPKERLTQRQATELAHASEPWAELLHTWIEVVTREDLHQGIISRDEQGGKAFAWIDKGKKPGKVLRGKHQVTLKLGNNPAITPAQWGRMLAKASDETRPPEAHVFLRDARHARTSDISAGRYWTLQRLRRLLSRSFEMTPSQAAIRRLVRMSRKAPNRYGG